MQLREKVRVGIINGYPRADRDDLDRAGMTSADQLYINVLKRSFPEFHLTSLFPADPESPMPSGAGLADFDAFIWTGSKLTIYHDIPAVTRQIAFSKALFEAGKPQFGSCWGVQMAAVAAGGEVAKMPQGRETFIARKITLTPEGSASKLYEGKGPVFDGFVNHLDEVVRVPSGGVLLSVGSHCRVQALEVRHKQGVFWGLQYHPEYNLMEMARLMEARAEALIKEGFFPGQKELKAHTGKMLNLFDSPGDETLKKSLGVGPDILGAELREAELRNFFKHLVFPNMKH